MINERVEQKLHRFLTHRILLNPESIVHAIGGIEDHLHLAVSIPPTILVSDWIGELKGSSSHNINHSGLGTDSLHWQSGYGIVTFGQKDLDWLVRYIKNQREHHYKGTFIDRFERITQIETIRGVPVDSLDAENQHGSSHDG